jgi:hypothetical protein
MRKEEMKIMDVFTTNNLGDKLSASAVRRGNFKKNI